MTLFPITNLYTPTLGYLKREKVTTSLFVTFSIFLKSKTWWRDEEQIRQDVNVGLILIGGFLVHAVFFSIKLKYFDSFLKSKEPLCRTIRDKIRKRIRLYSYYSKLSTFKIWDYIFLVHFFVIYILINFCWFVFLKYRTIWYFSFFLKNSYLTKFCYQKHFWCHYLYLKSLKVSIHHNIISFCSNYRSVLLY